MTVLYIILGIVVVVGLFVWMTYNGLVTLKIRVDEAKRLVKDTHQRVMDIIKSHSNDDLFKKKVYDWTGSSSLGSYLVSATASHYDWAMKPLRKIH